MLAVAFDDRREAPPPGRLRLPLVPRGGGARAPRVASARDKGILILLASFLGTFGVDRFYREQIGLGILKVVTFDRRGLWNFVDIVMYRV